jgi:hypothetical protein
VDYWHWHIGNSGRVRNKKRMRESMGSSASRIWSDICAIESDDVRAHMIETVMLSPEHVSAARQAGVYGPILSWLSAYQRGIVQPFPFQTDRVAIRTHGFVPTPPATGFVPPVGGFVPPPASTVQRDSIQHDSPRWTMYTTPVAPARSHSYPSASTSTALVVSPAAKALDYFQEALEMLGISETEELTPERLKAGFKRASLRAHPDKGGSKEKFDELRKAYSYVDKIVQRVVAKRSKDTAVGKFRPVTMESAIASREESRPVLADAAPVTLSAKKLDMATFNKLFEENRLPDPARDAGYGDWLKSTEGSDEITIDPRLKGKVTPQNFESVFRESALRSGAAPKRYEPEALMPTYGTELGADTSNFSAAFGSNTLFTDLKEAYTTGATMFQDIADVRVSERSVKSISDAERIRAEEMARVDPGEKDRFKATEAAFKERERQRKQRLDNQDSSAEAWFNQMRSRLNVTEG